MWGGDASGWRCVEVEACGREGRTVANRDMVEVWRKERETEGGRTEMRTCPRRALVWRRLPPELPFHVRHDLLAPGRREYLGHGTGLPIPNLTGFMRGSAAGLRTRVHGRRQLRLKSTKPSVSAGHVRAVFLHNWSPTSLLYHGNSGHDQRARSKPRRRAGDTRNLRTFVVERGLAFTRCGLVMEPLEVASPTLLPCVLRVGRRRHHPCLDRRTSDARTEICQVQYRHLVSVCSCHLLAHR